jgi:YgiT-type zinc finger domain-containing protein
MRCVFCGGKVIAKNVTFIYEQGEQLLVIRDVPAEVCTMCGERTFSPEITDEIIKFAKQRFEPVKLLSACI